MNGNNSTAVEIIVETLKQSIQQGTLNPGDKLPTLKQMEEILCEPHCNQGSNQGIGRTGAYLQQAGKRYLYNRAQRFFGALKIHWQGIRLFRHIFPV